MRRARPVDHARARWLAALLGALVLAGGASVRAEDHVSTGPWEVVRDDDGIRVERRTVATSPLHEFRGRGVINAPLARILAVIQDSAHRTEWMSQCVEAHTTEDVSDLIQISYNQTGAPWPISNRDVVLRGETQIDVTRGEVLLHFASVEDSREPRRKGVVRMPFLRGHWLLRVARGDKTTDVEYQVHADPGGALPNWIINLVSKRIPFETIAGLRRQVAHRRYPEFERKVMSRPEYVRLIRGEIGVPASTN